MVKPTQGRTVLFSGEISNGIDEHPAVITRVWSDTHVNLTVNFDGSVPGPRTSVRYSPLPYDLRMRLHPPDNSVSWRWPPREDGVAGAFPQFDATQKGE